MLRRVMMAKSAGASGDPYWENVISLIHFDGADGSKVFTDQTGRVWTSAGLSGSAVIHTARSVFGGASLYLPGDSALQAPISADFSFGTADFTIEAWVYTTSKNRVLLDLRQPIAPGIVFYQQTGGLLGVYCNMGATVTVLGSTDIADGTWHHVAFVRKSGVLRIYVDGALDGSGAMENDLSLQSRACIGMANTSALTWVGGIDEFRVTKGVARYAGDFLPQGPFPGP